MRQKVRHDQSTVVKQISHRRNESSRILSLSIRKHKNQKPFFKILHDNE